MLDKAEQKVARLRIDTNGELEEIPFAPQEES
jgi:hypothetical protein